MKKNNYLKRTAAVVLASVMAFSMAACGDKTEDTVQTNTMPEFVYVPEYIELEGGENVNLHNAVMAQDSLYYLTYEYNEEEMSSTTKLCRYNPMEGGAAAQVPLDLGENGNINTFAVDKDGNIYLYMEDYSAVEGTAEAADSMAAAAGELGNNPKSFIAKFDAQGTLVYEQEITEVMQEDEENSYVNSMAVDESGRLYLSCSNLVRLFESDGSYQGSIDMQDNWINSMGKGKDGKVYVTYFGSGSGMTLTEVDFTGKKLGNSYENFPSGNGSGSLSPGGEKDFLIQDGTKLMEYDMASQATSDVLTWLDSDINGQYVDNVGVLSDGRVLAAISDWGTGKTELALLKKTKSSELVQKEQLTVGTLSVNQTLQAAAVSFNKSSEKYHVNIKNYIDDNAEWTETTWSDAIAKLNNDITSGANSPDILDLSQLNTGQLAAKGVFEDLTPYLENSTVLDKDDFMKNILDSFTYDEKLIAIPGSFGISTVIGKSADVGEEMGWTLDELIAYAQDNEGANLFYNASKGSIMNTLLYYNMDSFVDWETGTCKFDTPEFKKLLEFVNTFPDEIDWEADTRSQPAQIAAGDVLLAEAYLYDLESIQQYIAMFGKEPVTFIGYPTVDGSVGCMLNAGDAYGISGKSQNKEGAWAFVEHYLKESSSEDFFFRNGLPTRQSELDKMIEEATKEEYVTDENGEPVLDESGAAIVAGGMSSISYGDWEYTFHTPTKEEADMLRELIKVAKPAAGSDSELSNIIMEEAEAFYKGQQSVDNVTKVIQSRAQLYVSENS